MHTIGYSYDAVGNRTGLGVTLAGAATPTLNASYGFDAANRLQSVAEPSLLGSAGQVVYEYNSAGHLTTISHPNGATTTYGYDSAGRLVSVSSVNTASEILASFGYTLDGRGFRSDAAESFMLPQQGVSSSSGNGDDEYVFTESQSVTGSGPALFYRRVAGEDMQPLAHPLAQSSGSTFVVNSTGDAVDSNVGDGLCNAGGACTLRAAIQEANAVPGKDTIIFRLMFRTSE